MKERRSDAEGEAILDEALETLRARKILRDRPGARRARRAPRPARAAHARSRDSARGCRRERSLEFALTRVPDGVEDACAYIVDALDEAERGWSRPFATTLAGSGEVVGSTRFMDLQYWAVDGRPPGVPVVAEIGATWLAPSVQRTPVNTEAKYLLLRHAFESGGCSACR